MQDDCLYYVRLQEEHRAWRNKNFPDEADGKLPHRQFFGLVEELGELDDCRAAKALGGPTNLIPVNQGGTHHTLPRREAIADCVADFVIFAAGYCNDNALDLAAIVREGDRLVPVSEPADRSMLSCLGMLAHHHLKMEQQIRGSREKHRSAIQAALVLLFIKLMRYSVWIGLPFHDIVRETWEGKDGKPGVRDRDWSKDPARHV